MPKEARIKVIVDGEEMSLVQWADINNVPYFTALKRYQAGEHDPWRICGDGYKTRDISPDDIKWLLETRPCRKGTPDEWTIACDLIGVPRSSAPLVKRAVLEAERKRR